MVTAKINASLQVHIAPVDDRYSLEQPSYALNWFNTRLAWLYDIYNLLGARSVRRVGGIPLFKASIGRTVHGQPHDYRDKLLIVRYPNAQHFKAMLESRYFQAVSLLRMWAVEDFTFAISQRADKADSATESDHSIRNIEVVASGAYAIHHFKAERGNTVFQHVQALAEQHGANLGFASEVSAHLSSEYKDKPPQVNECLMNNCLILQADTEEQLEQLFSSSEYQSIINSTESSFIALMQRHTLI